jgi:hypothetical protein
MILFKLGITAHFENLIMFVVFHCDPVVSVVARKIHFDDYWALF